VIGDSKLHAENGFDLIPPRQKPVNPFLLEGQRLKKNGACSPVQVGF